jgi:hypothetical protein
MDKSKNHRRNLLRRTPQDLKQPNLTHLLDFFKFRNKNQVFIDNFVNFIIHQNKFKLSFYQVNIFGDRTNSRSISFLVFVDNKTAWRCNLSMDHKIFIKLLLNFLVFRKNSSLN